MLDAVLPLTDECNACNEWKMKEEKKSIELVPKRAPATYPNYHNPFWVQTHAVLAYGKEIRNPFGRRLYLEMAWILFLLFVSLSLFLLLLFRTLIPITCRCYRVMPYRNPNAKLWTILSVSIEREKKYLILIAHASYSPVMVSQSARKKRE